MYGSPLHSALHPAETCGSLWGQDPVTLGVFAQIRRLASERCPVLVHGDTGTGKELAARALHELGRPTAPWVAVNCAAIAGPLAPSEFFGHERGAFTGAVKRRVGAFERAHLGTLFLDEIGELPMAMQAQLLRVLETQEFSRVGSTATLTSRFRLITATHRDLRREVQEGRFREDLFFRLSVASVDMPCLQSRLGDLPILCEQLLRRQRAGDWCVSVHALRRLAKYSWPGNVRELSNVLLRARLAAEAQYGPRTGRSRRRRRILEQHLALPKEYSTAQETVSFCRETTLPYGAVQIFGRRLSDIEREIFQMHLQAAGWSQAEAARRLGLPRQTLNDRLRKLGLQQRDLKRRELELAS